MDGTDQSSLELGEVEVRITKFALHLSTPSSIIIQNSMKSVRIKSGEEFSLICEVNGRPTPTILWYKNNLQIKRQWFHYSFLNYGIRIINSKTSELKYQFVTPSDSGNYTCNAQNIYGHVQKSINIEVLHVTSTESITTSKEIISKDTTTEPLNMFNNQVTNEYPCLSDHDCLRNSCKVNISVSKRGSYKTCVCLGENDLPKCRATEIRKTEIFSNQEKFEQNTFTTCKDGCDPNMSRLFLLSMLSLLLFLLVVFLIMVLITKKQRSRYKCTYSTNGNSDTKNEKCSQIDKNISQLDNSSNASLSFGWEIINPIIYSEGSKYFAVQPTASGETFYHMNKTITNPKNRFPFFLRKLFTSSHPKERNFNSTKDDNFDFLQTSAKICNKDFNPNSANIVMNNFNTNPHLLEESSFSINSVNDIL